MGLRNVIASIVMLLAAASSAAAQPSIGGGTGEYRGLLVKDRGALAGECSSMDFLSGVRPSNTGGSCSLASTSIVSARDYLYCDGLHDDRVNFKTLVESGGACAGKACVFDADCTMLFSACTSGTGDCSVASVAPGTRLLAEPGTNPTVKLAGRSCVGGSTPGAACPNGSSDCNGGTCTYDCASSGSAGCAVTDKVFLHTTAATYTLFKSGSQANASCTSAGSPWSCCTGTGAGVCQYQKQGIEISGFRIAARQLEDYQRCTNGSTENGWACNGYCGSGTTFPGMSCSEDGNITDCLGTPTCVNKALCPGANNDCDGTPLSITGTGSLNIVDMSTTAGVVVRGNTVTDYVKGSGIKVGINGFVDDNNLIAVSGNQYALPWGSLATFGLGTLTYSIPMGIQADWGSVVSNNTVRATTTGIQTLTTSGLFAVYQPSSNSVDVSHNTVLCPATGCVGVDVATPTSGISDNTVSCAGDGCIGIRFSAAGASVLENTVNVTAGDYTTGILGTGADASVVANHVALGPSTDTDGVGVELRGDRNHSASNVIDVAHATRGTGLRLGTTTGSCFPNCGGGDFSTSTGDTAVTGAGGVHVELFGDSEVLSAYATTGASGSQLVSYGQNSQTVVDGASLISGAVGVGPDNRKFCNGGTNDGKICKQDTTAAATCSGGGTCTYDDTGSNYSVMNSRLAFQTQTGIYTPTGGLLGANYVAWQVKAVVIGDDRVNVGLTATHGSINGGLLHVQVDNTQTLSFADVASGNCTAADTPWDCCTGNGTGTCIGAHGNWVFSGIDMLTFANTGVAAFDFANSFDSNSPNISNITIAGNGCYFAGTGTSCVNFPATNQNKITNIQLSGNNSLAATYATNWSPAMGRRDDEFTACVTKAALVGTDDSYPIFNPFFPVTVVGVACRCKGTCGGTTATFTLEDGGANAMTISGTNPTCATTGATTFAAVSGSAASLAAGGAVAFNVTNTPQTGNTYIVCVRYTKS